LLFPTLLLEIKIFCLCIYAVIRDQYLTRNSAHINRIIHNQLGDGGSFSRRVATTKRNKAVPTNNGSTTIPAIATAFKESSLLPLVALAFVDSSAVPLGPILTKLGDSLGNTAGSSLGRKLEEARDPLGSTVGSSLGRKLGEALGKTLGDPLGSTVGSSLGKKLGEALGKKLGDPLGSTDGS
jgi:hypothetical protein